MRVGRRSRVAAMTVIATVVALVVLQGTASAAGTAPSTARPAGAAAAPHLFKVAPRGHAARAIIPGAMINHGGPVETNPLVYVDFWGWTSDPNGEQPYLTRFLSSVGGTPWLASVNQYGAGSSVSLLAGIWSDGAAIPVSPSDAQIQQEGLAAARHFGVGTSANVQIVVATPTGHSTPGFGSSFCAYHGALGADPNVTYTNLPYMTDAGANCGLGAVNGAGGTLDGVSIVEGHELAEVVTDPLLNAWFDAGGNENGDKCAWTNLANIGTSAGRFAVQPLWSNSANGCALATGGVSGYEVAFQANTTNLWVTGSAGTGDLGLGMMPGTSPSIAAMPGGGYEVAFQANTGNLWVTGSAGTGDLGLGMRSGTSPSIAALPGGGYQVAFQANTTNLWVTGSAGTGDLGLGMASGTSPSIAALPGGGYEIAFQANTTNLWVTGSAGTGDLGLGMRSGTSPSIAALPNGGYEVAFQANTTNLWVTGSAGTGDLGLGMASGTSPSIAALPSGGYEIAFQANTTNLWVTGSAGTGDLGLGMRSGTSPSIAALPSGGYEVAFQANTTNLWVTGSAGTGDLGLGMGAGTSPSIMP
jgi:hypothetical protein